MAGTNKVIKGGDMMLFIDDKAIAMATSHTLSISADTKETSSKDAGGKWQTSEVGLLSWTCKSENILTNDPNGNGYSDLFDLMIAGTAIDAVFAPKAETADNVPEAGWTAKANTGYTGKVIITNLEQNAPNGENATFTVDFTGVGALTKVPTA